ncbi:hypothetical protein GGR52DRAFT_536400 [Hypoxylon sp. FL1284]|nr:hypothetical protein GGR52DRAFT_536400 [Hypoxylon sp. FL1284]
MAMAMASRPDDGDATKRYPWYHNVTLEDVLPRRGFLFAEDHKIFDTVQDGLVAKWALHVATPWFEEYKIDEALAAVMNEFLRLLTIVRNPSGSCYLTEDQIDEIFEHAGQSFSWAEHLPKGFLSRLMGKMIRGRFVYVRLTEMRGMPESDVGKKTGQLAAAIDVWRREKPFEKPDESWTRMPAMFVDYAMERFIQGKGADVSDMKSSIFPVFIFEPSSLLLYQVPRYLCV